jgi:hypothetical protein
MKIVDRALSRAVAALGAAAVLTQASAAGAQARRVSLPVGTVIPVRLDRPLSSRTAMAGDKFTATVRAGRDDADLPVGTRVEGVVREAIPAAKGKPGVLDLDFRRIVFPGGHKAPLDASLISLDAKSVKRSETGRLVASTDKSKDRLKFIGIGAGAGLVIGSLLKGNAIQDTLMGAAAGYLYNEFKKDKPGDVNLKEGAEFGVRLERSIGFTTNRASRAYAGEPTASAADRSNDPNPRDGATPDGGDIGVLVDDQDVALGHTRPFVRDGSVLVPIEPVARAAGLEFRYDAANRIVSAGNGETRMGIGSRIAVVRGVRKRLTASPEIRDDKLYVPMQFIALAIGGSAQWDESSRTVVISTGR